MSKARTYHYCATANGFYADGIFESVDPPAEVCENLRAWLESDEMGGGVTILSLTRLS